MERELALALGDDSAAVAAAIYDDTLESELGRWLGGDASMELETEPGATAGPVLPPESTMPMAVVVPPPPLPDLLGFVKTMRQTCQTSNNAAIALVVQLALEHRQQLVAQGLIPELDHIRVPDLDRHEGCDLQFLRHKVRAGDSATCTLGGPASGYLWAGNEARFGGEALLKLNGSLKQGHDSNVSVAGWSRVRIPTSLDGKLQHPKEGEHFTRVDGLSSVSIVSQVLSKAAAKRQRTGAGASSEASSSADALLGASSGPHHLNVRGDATVGGAMSVSGDVQVGGNASIAKNAVVGGSMNVGGELKVGGAVVLPNGDFAEHLPRRDSSEHIEEGDVVVQQGKHISKAVVDGAPTPAGWFVASSVEQACMVGKMPANPEDISKGNPIGYLGQMSVRVSGGADVGAKLVPSGLGDGCARALAQEDLDHEEALHVLGVVIGPSTRAGFVQAFVAPGLSASMSVGPMLERLRRLEDHVQTLQKALELIRHPEFSSSSTTG